MLPSSASTASPSTSITRRLRHDAVADRDGRGAGTAHAQLQDRDPRQRVLPARPPADAGRRVCDARQITGGRLITGLVRGVGAEYYSFGVNPVLSHERSHRGPRSRHPGVDAARAVRVRGQALPLRIREHLAAAVPAAASADLVPSQGSAETIEWAADPRRKYLYMQNFNPFSAAVRYPQLLSRGRADPLRLRGRLSQLGWAAPLYVAATDRQAMDEAREPIDSCSTRSCACRRHVLPARLHSARSGACGATRNRSWARSARSRTSPSRA